MNGSQFPPIDPRDLAAITGDYRAIGKPVPSHLAKAPGWGFIAGLAVFALVLLPTFLAWLGSF